MREGRRGLLTVRAEKKARELIRHFNLEPTDEEWQHGTILSGSDQDGNLAQCAFIKTNAVA
jgi:hypothetical protein